MWKGSITQENGINIVNNPKEPIYKDTIFEFVEELSIGQNKEDNNYQFSTVYSLAVDLDENIYILDFKECCIKKFSKNGDHIMTIGRKGNGPGEFTYPATISIVDDIILIEDLVVRKISFFRTNGDFIRMISTAEYLFMGVKINQRKNIVARNSLEVPDGRLWTIKLFDVNFTHKKDLYEALMPKNNFIEKRRLVAYFSEDTTLAGYSDKYEINVFDSDGSLKKIIKREYDPVKSTDKDLDFYIEYRGYDSSAKNKRTLPKYLNSFVSFSSDDVGNIFVQTNRNHPYSKLQSYDIFNASGKYIARMDLSMKPYIWKNKKLYTIETNDDGFPIIKRYKVIQKTDINI